MKKYVKAIKIERENFAEVALMSCVREISKTQENIQGISSMFLMSVLRLHVGNDIGRIGDYLVLDVCDNWHVMTEFDYNRVKDETI